MTTKALNFLNNLTSLSPEENFIIDTFAQLETIRLNKKVDLKTISEHSKISEKTLTEFINSDKTPTLSDINRIADALNLKLKMTFIPKK